RQRGDSIMMKTCVRLAAVAAFAILSLAPAYGQATRTWVSGVGDDVNPCSRTAPCKTFAGAISKTAAGGEINCLDPGGFGAVTITKSITIDCTGTFGSVLNSGGINGIVINDSASATPRTAQVRLRGLSINGAGTTPGLNGIRFISGASLVIEDVFIQNQRGGNGISIAPSAGAIFVSISNSSVNTSGSATGSGIEVRPTGTGAATVSLRNVRITNNVNFGLRVDSTATTGSGVTLSMETSETSGALQGISVAAGAGPATTSILMVNDVAIFNNSNSGILANGGGATVRVANSRITGSGIGVNRQAGAFISDLGGNLLANNTTNGTFN
ncbi:MAG TPA: hypothetical protein VGC46_04455, partial [Allosphingosinicella sp.]